MKYIEIRLTRHGKYKVTNNSPKFNLESLVITPYGRTGKVSAVDLYDGLWRYEVTLDKPAGVKLDFRGRELKRFKDTNKVAA